MVSATFMILFHDVAAHIMIMPMSGIEMRHRTVAIDMTALVFLPDSPGAAVGGGDVGVTGAGPDTGPGDVGGGDCVGGGD